MGGYRLSEAAVRDFDRIYDHGIDEFGLDQASAYQNRLIRRFTEISQAPLRYVGVEHIHSEHRRSVCGAHSIYYRIDPEEVVIVRILGRQYPGIALGHAGETA